MDKEVKKIYKSLYNPRQKLEFVNEMYKNNKGTQNSVYSHFVNAKISEEKYNTDFSSL